MARTAGARKQDSVVGDVSPTGPDLLTVYSPSAGGVVARRARLEGGEVRAGGRLGEQLAPNVLAAEDGGQQARLLLLSAEVDDRGPREPFSEHVQTVRRARAVVLLQEDRLLEERRLLSTVGRRPGESRKAGCVELPLPAAPVRQAVLDRRGLRARQFCDCPLEPRSDPTAVRRPLLCVVEVHLPLLVC